MAQDLDTLTDVGELWELLRAAKAFGDSTLVAAIERRMREVGGHNDERAQAFRDGGATTPAVLVSPLETGSGY